MDVQKFMAETKPQGGHYKLPFLRDAIMVLVRADYAQYQIETWLRLNGVFVCREALSQFIETEMSRRYIVNYRPDDVLMIEAISDLAASDPGEIEEWLAVCDKNLHASSS